MKTVLITGASRGIGAAIARRFADGGYMVIVNYNKSASPAEEIAKEIGGIAIQADVGDPKQVNRMMDEIESRFGGVDVLINNAGVSHIGLFTDMTEEEWQRMINVNLGGAFRITKRAVKPMIANHSGCVINISSMWGEVGASCEVAYSASKAGMIGMTKALAKELGPSNIRVNCITPGVIKTDMNKALDGDTIKELEEETPLGRLGTPEDVAAAAYFLSESEFITGQVLGVSGGFVI